MQTVRVRGMMVDQISTMVLPDYLEIARQNQ